MGERITAPTLSLSSISDAVVLYTVHVQPLHCTALHVSLSLRLNISSRHPPPLSL